MSSPALTGLLVEPREWLTARVGDSPLIVHPDAMGALLDGLEGRLARVVGPCLAVEYRAAGAVWGGAGPLGGDAGEWGARFRTWPGLGPVVEEVVERWREATRELLDRIEGDGAVLRDHLPPGADPRCLVGLRADAGDPHDRGRSVVIVEFEGGKVVYKPRDLRVVQVVADLFDWLCKRGWDEPNAVAPMTATATHAWMRFIDGGEPIDAAGCARYYRRLGGQIRVFQLLGARDLWLDNVVACGDRPIWVDLETVCHPVRDLDGSSAERAVNQELSWSVAHMSALNMRVAVQAGAPPEDLGLLRPAGLARLPFTADADAAAALGMRWPTTLGSRALPVGGHVPTTHDGPAIPAEHLDELYQGYAQVSRVLATNREAVMGPDGPLQGLVGLPVRYVHRSTWQAYQQLRRSVQPDLVGTQNGRDDWLRASVAGVDALGPAEAEALRGGDVPLFTVATDTVSIECAGVAYRLPDLVETAMAALDRRAPTQSDPKREQLTWNLAIASSCAAVLCAAPMPQAGSELRALSCARALVEAATIVDDKWAWLGAVLDPHVGTLAPGLLPPGLLGGRAGIAAVLVAFAGRYPDEFVDGATGSLASLPSRMSDVSLWTGEAGCVLALTRAAAALGEPWRSAARERGRRLMAEAGDPQRMVHALWAALNPDSRDDDHVHSLLDRLDEHGVIGTSVHPPPPAPFDQLLPGLAPFAAALAPWVERVVGRPTPWVPADVLPSTRRLLAVQPAGVLGGHLCALTGLGAEALHHLRGIHQEVWPLLP